MGSPRNTKEGSFSRSTSWIRGIRQNDGGQNDIDQRESSTPFDEFPGLLQNVGTYQFLPTKCNNVCNRSQGLKQRTANRR